MPRFGRALGRLIGREPRHARRERADEQIRSAASQAQSQNTQIARAEEKKIEQHQTVVEEVKQQLESVLSVLAQVDEKIDREAKQCKQHVISLVPILQSPTAQEMRSALISYFVQMDQETFVFFLTHAPDVFLLLTDFVRSTPLMVGVLYDEVKRRDAEPVSLAWGGQSRFFLPHLDTTRVAITEATPEQAPGNSL
jgi:hypothetical protein